MFSYLKYPFYYLFLMFNLNNCCNTIASTTINQMQYLQTFYFIKSFATTSLKSFDKQFTSSYTLSIQSSFLLDQLSYQKVLCPQYLMTLTTSKFFVGVACPNCLCSFSSIFFFFWYSAIGIVNC